VGFGGRDDRRSESPTVEIPAVYFGQPKKTVGRNRSTAVISVDNLAHFNLDGLIKLFLLLFKSKCQQVNVLARPNKSSALGCQLNECRLCLIDLRKPVKLVLRNYSLLLNTIVIKVAQLLN
jgi:hypothetical protein